MKKMYWCYIAAIVLAMLWLVVGVDYMPFVFAWLPLIGVIIWVVRDKEFLKWVISKLPFDDEE